ncbi:hypothetical protein GCM10010174_58780 [Kutzneria viridogrisea]
MPVGSKWCVCVLGVCAGSNPVLPERWRWRCRGWLLTWKSGPFCSLRPDFYPSLIRVPNDFGDANVRPARKEEKTMTKMRLLRVGGCLRALGPFPKPWPVGK